MDEHRGEGRGRGFRKAILINEHFVVYGVPAVAVPVFRPVEVSVELHRPGKGIRLWGFPGAGKGGDGEMVQAARAVMQGLGIDPEPGELRIRCRDDLPNWSGLGSSAGFCVALARALCEALGRSCPDETINRAAYQGERIFAANPSGIDNTVATYGRSLWYVRGRTPPWEWIRTAGPLRLVIGSSGLPASTREQVERVARFKEERPSVFSALLEEAGALVRKARGELEVGDWPSLGESMNQGHAMLRRLGVSHGVLDEMVAFCLREGALGAKLTGAGGGGCMIALVEDAELGTRIAAGLQRMGYPAICVEPGAEDHRGGP